MDFCIEIFQLHRKPRVVEMIGIHDSVTIVKGTDIV